MLPIAHPPIAKCQLCLPGLAGFCRDPACSPQGQLTASLSLLEALRNLGEWTSRGFGCAPDGDSRALTGVTARDAMLSAGHWGHVTAEEETPQQQTATEASSNQAGLRDPSTAGVIQAQEPAGWHMGRCR